MRNSFGMPQWRVAPRHRRLRPSSRHTLRPDEHAVEHAREDLGEPFVTTWRVDLCQYRARLATLAEMAPGDPTAEPTLRATAAFVSRAHNALASQRCSCAIAPWAYADTVRIYEQASRLFGATAAIPYAPTWRPLS
jgi:hypothetical protein